MKRTHRAGYKKKPLKEQLKTFFGILVSNLQFLEWFYPSTRRGANEVQFFLCLEVLLLKRLSPVLTPTPAAVAPGC